MRSLKLTLIAAMVLALTTPAGAGGSVDWSAYIDHDAPSRPTPKAAERGPAERAQAPKASRANKKVAKKATKAKAKQKARRKKPRR